ncbi:Uncharacterized protein GBIM_01981 [Gryllus bimaculatus]|nr:Uncharacterized protein GBIM_01981 [Gryllus bimaculatus]
MACGDSDFLRLLCLVEEWRYRLYLHKCARAFPLDEGYQAHPLPFKHCKEKNHQGLDQVAGAPKPQDPPNEGDVKALHRSLRSPQSQDDVPQEPPSSLHRSLRSPQSQDDVPQEPPSSLHRSLRSPQSKDDVPQEPPSSLHREVRQAPPGMQEGQTAAEDAFRQMAEEGQAGMEQAQ